MNIFKEFLLYRRIRKEIKLYNEITKSDKIHLQSISRETENKINGILYNKLCIDMVDGKLSDEFVKGFKFALNTREGLFRDYHITFDKPIDKQK